ncbi:cell wall hydrolase [Paenibacillus protaetiae]|uniref:Spore cortex-lytic enzyme n=1 Tax=Paenibacillus protaetiae TaxID=2509456 RepID=A0A4P6FBQ1_9BACL|nr:cell wall hydrolase [Paenibacillus protaetiae]QAY67978.1 spore cortex-lytic enzyme [Paenibacillus protaetiae]
MMRKWVLMMMTALLLSAAALHNKVEAASLKIGAQGDAVKDLQYRLAILNYYTNPIVPTYDNNTAAAVKKFQKGAGLAADGVAGQLTIHALHKVSASKADVTKIARVIYAEGRGEPYQGQIAIGAVIMNRVKAPSFPKTVNDVIFAPNAFSVVAGGQYWLIPDNTAIKAAKAAATGSDPSKDAFYFYNGSATSDWMLSRPVTVKIGHHVFAK